jgi:hypothetical protein
MHGFRDKALVLTIAAAAAAGGASSVAAATHDEAGLTARGITPSYVAVHDEAILAARGIESVVASAHDEAARGALELARAKHRRPCTVPLRTSRRSHRPSERSQPGSNGRPPECERC